ncbi:MAG: hypothetical protein WCH86_07190, partial [Kiritimatiellales bacterium]
MFGSLPDGFGKDNPRTVDFQRRIAYKPNINMKSILLPIFILFLMLVCGCCNFYQLAGNGPDSRSEWTDCLPDATTQQMDEIRVEAAT